MASVYTGGTFDLLHAGHIDLLKACREIAGSKGQVTVGLNSDEFITRFKGKPPVCTYDERKHILEACSYVDRVIKNYNDEDSKPAIISLHPLPDFIVIGDDWACRDYYKQMGFTREWLVDHGISLLYVARLRKLSSTAIKDRTYGQLDTLPLST